MRPRSLLLTVALTTPAIHAQWTIQTSHTTAGLRGIHAVSDQIAWASGTEGAILHTTDGGTTWQTCTIPPDAEKLDFRGIQAFDASTAIAMSSGKGDLSRLYKTTDACRTWKLVFTNPDKEGFWDAYVIPSGGTGILVGDPVQGHIAIWRPNLDAQPPSLGPFHHRPTARKSEAEFAASNSSLFVANPFWDFWIATGGPNGSRVIKRTNHDFDSFGFDSYSSKSVPVGGHTASSGIFSLVFRPDPIPGNPDFFKVGVAVGGDYLKPEDATNVAALTTDSAKTWHPATTQPRGYRSAVAYFPTTKSWITVGPNGTDLSTDDGRNWHPLHPNQKFNDTPDADRDWNALSLPFVVGPKGRIGRLHAAP